MPPGLRELYSAWLGAGRYAVVTPALDVLARWLRREDPTKGLEEFQRRAEAASYASPWAHLVGQGIGLAGIAGLTAEGLIARGVGASNIERLVSGLRASAKPAAVGGAAGAAAGVAVGAATGRDPLAEAAKFGAVGFTAGLGGVTRGQLAAGGILGATVGGTTAREYGTTKGLEAGSTVFLLPIVAPERLARGIFAGFTAGRRLATQQEPAPLREVPREWVKLRRGMSPEEAAEYALELRWNPEEQREFFKKLIEEALSRERAGDASAFNQLRYFRMWLEPVSRQRFDQLLKEYGLIEMKHWTHEYGLEEKYAPALARIFRRDMQRTPEYALTDEAAALLDQFLRMGDKTVQIFMRVPAERVQIFRRRVRPADASRPGRETWLVPSEASQIQLFRPAQTHRLELEGATRQEYAFAPLVATRQDQRQTYATAPATAQVAAQRTAQRTVATQTEVATTTTPGRTITTTPPPETPPRTPPPSVPPYIPPWMLSLPVAVALPLLAQMGLRLPPPPNPHMPLGAYLRMLRFPALGRQREVFVLI